MGVHNRRAAEVDGRSHRGRKRLYHKHCKEQGISKCQRDTRAKCPISLALSLFYKYICGLSYTLVNVAVPTGCLAFVDMTTLVVLMRPRNQPCTNQILLSKQTSNQ